MVENTPEIRNLKRPGGYGVDHGAKKKNPKMFIWGIFCLFCSVRIFLKPFLIQSHLELFELPVFLVYYNLHLLFTVAER